ncbi:hypothetical protein Pla52n_51180 [Stieleria varia]|uniref:Uncharacterized protein n=1 Tax=Stieleria varia TaxID=2528005 RepID=A0A5C6AHT4_9BACT|nr:hypothetical protein Pla52n_51180 [Stieleria varia]
MSRDASAVGPFLKTPIQQRLLFSVMVIIRQRPSLMPGHANDSESRATIVRLDESKTQALTVPWLPSPPNPGEPMRVRIWGRGGNEYG